MSELTESRLISKLKRYSGGFRGEGNEAGEKSGDCGDGL